LEKDPAAASGLVELVVPVGDQAMVVGQDPYASVGSRKAADPEGEFQIL
jgi:hypothetical protein